MRIAMISDIHGNAIALDAVLADIEAQGGVDAYWILGDLVFVGSDPIGVLERVVALPNVSVIHGNTERYVVTEAKPVPTLEQTQKNPDLIPIYAEVAASKAWTRGALAYTGWIDWLANLPFEIRTTLPDGTRVLGVHSSPRNDYETIFPYTNQEELQVLADLAEADLVFCGHIHWQWETKIGAVHWVNCGCIGNPVMPHLQATYAILDGSEAGYTVDLRQVDFDRTAAKAQAFAQKHPAAEFIGRFLDGKFIMDHTVKSEPNEMLWER